MRTHRLKSGNVRVDCPRSIGNRCRICELMDPAHPDFDARFLGLYEPSCDEPGAVAAAHGDRDRLIRGCDYRLEPVGLERGDACGCVPATRCLLGKGKWEDAYAIDYSDCLACVSVTKY